VDLEQFKAHMDGRLDKIESKLDTSLEKQATHASQIQHLQGFAKLVISIIIATAGFFALAFFNQHRS
jgi:hypothetical protein